MLQAFYVYVVVTSDVADKIFAFYSDYLARAELKVS